MFSKSKKEIRSNYSNKAFNTLALNNVKKSIKDYMIYFITLVFGAALLYTFNSLDNNLALLSGNMLLEAYLNMARIITALFSVVICLIFGFLITYSNNFLMRKRKREFGIYITLGMNKKSINRLMFKETCLIGLFSLICGLLIGFFASQGLTLITYNMLGISNDTFKFSISFMATIKTIIFFTLVLFLVNLFNKKNISKYNLIDLINSNKKNETSFSKNNSKKIILFFISLILIGVFYLLLTSLMKATFLSTGLIISIFIISFCALALGLFLFFISVSDFFTNIIKKRKKTYYNKLNMYVLGQIASRIKSMSSSFTIISILLFLSMIIIPCGISFSKYITFDLKKSTPYDVSITRYNIAPNSYDDEIISPKINKNSISFLDEFKDSNLDFNLLTSSINKIDEYSLNSVNLKDFSNSDFKIKVDYNLPVISLSDYNNARIQQGLTPITLGNNQFAINYNLGKYKDMYDDFIKNPKPLDVNGNPLVLGQKELYNITTSSVTVLNDIGTIIVPDKIISDLQPTRTTLNINYVERNNEYDNMFINKYHDFTNSHKKYNYSLITKISVDGEKISLNTTFSFVSIYLGMILLISAGAILALQQISDAASNKEKFIILKRLGAKKSDIRNALIKQVSIIFALPLFLSILNSFFTYIVLSDFAKELSGAGIVQNIIITLILVLILYGTYFLLSLKETLNIINEK